MKLVGKEFLEVFGGRCLNTHPALLPSFPGRAACATTLAHGVKVPANRLHRRRGRGRGNPIVAQASVPVADDDEEGDRCTSGSR